MKKKFRMDKLQLWGAKEVDDYIERLNELELEVEEDKAKKLEEIIREIAWHISALNEEMQGRGV